MCWRLDRLGRNLRHLVMLLDDWQSRGIAFVTLGEGIDTSTPAGRLVAGVLGSIAEFERARIQERIMAGLARARAHGQAHREATGHAAPGEGAYGPYSASGGCGVGRVEVDGGAAATSRCRRRRGTTLRDSVVAFATICAGICEAGDGETTRDNQLIVPDRRSRTGSIPQQDG